MRLEVEIKKKLKDFVLEVHLSVAEEVCAILGPSGAGKTMLLKCIAGIETPDEGRIVLGNQVLYDQKEKINLSPQERKIGYLFQDYALFPHLTVKENILLATEEREEVVEEWLQEYELEEKALVYPRELSGGQKQRVALLRMMASKPRCVLLDEPYSAMDYQLKWRLQQEMKQWLKYGNYPTILVSHDREEVSFLSRRVGCIHQGRLGKLKEKEVFFQSPTSKIQATLSGGYNITEVEEEEDGTWFATNWNRFIGGRERKKLFGLGIKEEKIDWKDNGGYPVFLEEIWEIDTLEGSRYMGKVKGGGILRCYKKPPSPSSDCVYLPKEEIIFFEEE